eukprot:scaffold6.g2540.t1
MAKPEGYLVVKVLEAAGHNSSDQPVWDASFTEGFVKVEIRGGPRTIKKQTPLKRVVDSTIEWDEQLALEVLESASELRIMLCREKRSGDKVGTSIVAACGIYMRDILDAVPIDKYFELFKPGVGAEGGFIRVSMSYLLPDQVRSGNGALLGGAARREEKRSSGLLRALGIGVAAALAAFAARRFLDKGKGGGSSSGGGGKAAGGKQQQGTKTGKK